MGLTVSQIGHILHRKNGFFPSDFRKQFLTSHSQWANYSKDKYLQRNVNPPSKALLLSSDTGIILYNNYITG